MNAGRQIQRTLNRSQIPSRRHRGWNKRRRPCYGQGPSSPRRRKSSSAGETTSRLANLPQLLEATPWLFKPTFPVPLLRRSRATTEPKTYSDFVVSFYAVLRSNDLEAWLANFAPGAIAHVPVGAPSHYGHTRLRNFHLRLGSVRDVRAGGDRCVSCTASCSRKMNRE